MAMTSLSRNLWWVMALLVLLTPLAMNQLLNSIAPMSGANSPVDATRTGVPNLPTALPMRFPTRMKSTHQALPNGWYKSQYSNELSDSNEGLVPYIPRMFDITDFTSLQQNSREIDGEMYSRLLLRKKFSPRHYLAYFQYQVGTMHTESYTKAKLYQIPAALRGAQMFTLTIWQRQCKQADCQQESDQLEAWLAD